MQTNYTDELADIEALDRSLRCSLLSLENVILRICIALLNHELAKSKSADQPS